MEFIHEGKAFRHYNAAGEMDAEITYVPKGEGVIEANHTFVDPSIRGQGVAHQLVDQLADFARKENLKIYPTCPYVVALFEKSTEYDDLKI
ncbi:GNAT family N-acetyltransferase [Neisseria sp. P0019.S003]|uniref:GNAT family N-acetyltransferase n=1 Tax=Neisseria sp. P0019.S003 TaxID=3436799 RepID=UPI003602F4C9